MLDAIMLFGIFVTFLALAVVFAGLSSRKTRRLKKAYQAHAPDFYRQQRHGELFSAAVVFVVLAGCVIIGAACNFGVQYSESIILPARLEAYDKTIEEQTALLFGCSQTVGSGIEGMSGRVEVQQMIDERNDLIATIASRRASAFISIKPQWPDGYSDRP